MLFTYWAMAFTATHLPGETVHGLGRQFRLPFGHLDKIAHFALYLGLSFLLMWFLHHRIRNRLSATLMTLAVALGYGALDEWLQSFVPNRSMDLADWAADGVGVTIGIGLFCVVHPVVSRWMSAPRRTLAFDRR